MSHSKKGYLTLQCVQRSQCHASDVAAEFTLPNTA